MDRSDFLKITGSAAAAIVLPGFNFDRTIAARKEVKTPLCVFSKFLHFLNCEDMGEALAEMGFDGVDLAVRPGGHVNITNVRKELPLAVKALNRNGIQVPMMVTSISRVNSTSAADILQTASDQGIKFYRTGYYQYDFAQTIQQNLDMHKKTVEELAAMNEKYGIHGGYQNHSGTNVGAPVWDLFELMKDVDPRFMGIQYDVRHAVTEGGYSWMLGMKRISPWIRTIDVKDFVWNKNDKGEWRHQSVPLGEGMVNYDDFLKEYYTLNIEAPVSIHYEYNLGGAENGSTQLTMSKKEIYACMKKDLDFFRGKLLNYQK